MKNRVLYAAGAVLFTCLFVGDAIDMALLWDNFTTIKIVKTSLHLLGWGLMAVYCVNEYRRRKDMVLKRRIVSAEI